MGTLADPHVRAACCDRLQRLSPDSKRRWGRMNAPQMVCHLNDSFRAAMGERLVQPATNLVRRTFVKWFALHAPVAWPHGMPTRPEVEQGRGGTPPHDWEQDRRTLVNSIHEFAGRQTFAPHPMFGEMSQRDWLTWGYRHVDHHLRQFGV